MTVKETLTLARAAAPVLAKCESDKKNFALERMARALVSAKDKILSANERDVNAAKDKLSPALIDRLTLTDARIESMAEGILSVAGLEDPVGRVLEETRRPNGLLIRRVAVPIGVVAIIYESRPNVTSDVAALTLKSGNVCVLKSGSDARESSAQIASALREGVCDAGLPRDCVCFLDDPSREAARELMTAVGLVDLLVPRGGAGLIKTCVENARVPCIETGTGICHIYVDESADLDMALSIVENAKMSRPGVCNAAECLLVHKKVAEKFLPALKERLCGKNANPRAELRLCPRAAKIISGTPAGERDFDTEFLDYILAVRVVDDLDGAIAHIAAHSTGHSEAIITEDGKARDKFLSSVDSAAVYVNASTRFTDGGEFGLGCELGISTQRLHARGPMGLRELCTYKYEIYGSGQVR